jgi:hypothetical protein
MTSSTLRPLSPLRHLVGKPIGRDERVVPGASARGVELDRGGRGVRHGTPLFNSSPESPWVDPVQSIWRIATSIATTAMVKRFRI